MKKRGLIFSKEASADLDNIAVWLTEEASAQVARRYLMRIREHLSKLAFASERGTIRNDVAEGLRVIGLTGSISVAFKVYDDHVVIARILWGGQNWWEEGASDED
jgi:toxin ParE1/3/4